MSKPFSRSHFSDYIPDRNDLTYNFKIKFPRKKKEPEHVPTELIDPNMQSIKPLNQKLKKEKKGKLDWVKDFERTIGSYTWGIPEGRRHSLVRILFLCPHIPWPRDQITYLHRESEFYKSVAQRRLESYAKKEVAILKMLDNNLAKETIPYYPTYGKIAKNGKPDRRYKSWNWKERQNFEPPHGYLQEYKKELLKREARPEKCPMFGGTILDYQKGVTSGSNILEFLYDRFIFLIEIIESYCDYCRFNIDNDFPRLVEFKNHYTHYYNSLSEVLRVYRIIQRYIKGDFDRSNLLLLKQKGKKIIYSL